ncbi:MULTISPECIES: hypothetical protein [unclassified Beijerinckia]|uniref:hypothetical protein n=1 Tax=unclassified Beijerinckia TaxID=2638183 RepID=UPI0008969E6F|nr:MULTISPECIES: hypothetical protein [unclassified Beijerinckia]MDH7796396.1 hypothetical protein [Beijerinckia sp. GAS462]SEC43371.1 hypothetical protein SAMN05443249_2679 [Beijerinckia sp. 28-YEA-48]
MLTQEQKQDYFDRAVGGLLKQGTRSLRKKDEDDIFCMYRSPQGHKCAVGMLIPDDKYSPKFDNGDDVMLEAVLTEGLGVGLENFDFFRDLQKVHDKSQVSEWPAHFAKFAGENGLNTKVIDEHTNHVV